MKTVIIKPLVLIIFCLGLFSCKKNNKDPIPPIKNKLVFVYKNDNNEGLAYKSVMELNGCSVDLIDKSTLPTFDFSPYDLIVIGNNTDTLYTPHWTPADTMVFYKAAKPMLLWGVGGTLLSLVLNNHVGNPGTGGFTLLAVNRNSTIFSSPLLIQIPANGVIPFYSQNCPAAGLYSATGNANLELVGKDPVFSIYTTVFVETKQVNLKTRRFGNFGYYLNTNAMDQPGKDFIVNFSYYVGQLKL